MAERPKAERITTYRQGRTIDPRVKALADDALECRGEMRHGRPER